MRTFESVGELRRLGDSTEKRMYGLSWLACKFEDSGTEKK